MKDQLVRLICLCCIFVISSCYSVSAAGLDPAFGHDGRVAVELGVYGDRAHAVVVQPDGKIVVAGSSSNASDKDFMLFRLLADGSLDPEFNFDGTVTSSVGSSDDEILTLALQEDGKIIAAGYSSNGTDRDFALARYNSDGSLDRNYGLEGLVVTPVGGSDDEITGMVVQPDGAAVVTGTAEGTAGRVIVLGRYLADGTLDTGFADGGFSFTGVGKEAQAESVALLDDQRILVSGSYTDGEKIGLMIVGFKPDGQLDEGFGENGVAVPAGDQPFSEGYGMFIRDDQKILVAGAVGEEGKRDAALFQFTAEGVADPGFEDNGLLVTPVGAEDDVLYDVVATGETIAATGFTTTGDSREFLYITYEDSKVTVRQEAVPETESSRLGDDSSLRIAELQVEESFEEYQAEQGSTDLLVDVVTTRFGDGDDVATALAVVPPSGIVVVGVSGDNGTTSAAVSKYVPPAVQTTGALGLEAGNTFIFTGQAYDVTRTTANIPVQIAFNPAITVGERGIVFSTVPNPILKDDAGDPGEPVDPPVDPGDGTTAPVRLNLEPSGTVTDSSVILSLSTDVNSQCRYTDTTSGMSYDLMKNEFNSDLTGTIHSASRSNLTDGNKIYYVRCMNLATNDVNTIDREITFIVDTSANTVFNRTFQLIGDLLVSPAMAQDSTTLPDGGIPVVSTAPDTETDPDPSTPTNIFDPNREDFIDEGVLKMGAGNGSFTAQLEKLQPGTFFYARAYAVADGQIYYGNQVGFRTGDSCFIATAAFGTIFHPCVRVLREFRDSYMLNNDLGRSLVTLYYRYSPSVADVIAGEGALRFITRVLLLPVVAAAWLTLHVGMKGLLLLAVAAGLCGYFMRRKYFWSCA